MISKHKTDRQKTKARTGFRLARALFVFGLGLVFLGGVAVFASKGGVSLHSFMQPSISLDLSGTVNRSDGKINLSKAGEVNPGEIIEWKIVSKNSGESNASNYKAIGQIPTGTEFIAGSANADQSGVFEYSIDGGRNYSEKPLINEKQTDGSTKLVPAPVRMFTQIRFSWNNPLLSGEKFNAFYSVRVK